MERLPVVDENNQIIDTKSREYVHEEKLPHRSVMFFVKDEEGNILVTKRSDDKEFYPGYWSIVLGGHVKAGQTYEESLKREVEEEIGTMGDHKNLGSFKKDIEEEMEFVELYEVRVSRSDISLTDEEFEKGVFWNKEKIFKEINKKEFLPETKTVIEYITD